jgi:hypothetical protein
MLLNSINHWWKEAVKLFAKEVKANILSKSNILIHLVHPSVCDTTFCCKSIFYVLTLWQNRLLKEESNWLRMDNSADSKEKKD